MPDWVKILGYNLDFPWDLIYLMDNIQYGDGRRNLYLCSLGLVQKHWNNKFDFYWGTLKSYYFIMIMNHHFLFLTKTSLPLLHSPVALALIYSRF
jgi:hypothetical protein